MKYIGLPRPSCPLGGMLEPVGFGFCNYESKKRNSLRSGAIVMKEIKECGFYRLIMMSKIFVAVDSNTLR